MFTIRHIEKNGFESLTQATNIWRDTQPDKADCGCNPGAVGRCDKEACPRKYFDMPMNAQRPDGTVDRYATGEIFVMNDSGKTVAKYAFD